MVTGRPPLFSTPEELDEKINEYFTYIQGESHFEEIEGKQERIYTREPQPPTHSGLALFLGFESRQSLYDYKKRPEFSYSIKKAILFIEEYLETALTTKHQVTGVIFALKNMGWKDATELDHKSSDGSMSPTPIKFTKGSNE